MVNVFWAWMRATEGSRKDRFLRTAMEYSYAPVLVLIIGFYLAFFGVVTDGDFCWVIIVVVLVAEAIAIYMAWRKCSR